MVLIQLLCRFDGALQICVLQQYSDTYMRRTACHRVWLLPIDQSVRALTTVSIRARMLANEKHPVKGAFRDFERLW